MRHRVRSSRDFLLSTINPLSLLKVFNRPIELIIDAPPPSVKSLPGASPDLKKALQAAGIPVEEVRTPMSSADKPSAKTKRLPAGPSPQKTFLKTAVADTEVNPWDVAHAAAAAAGNYRRFVEPDFLQEVAVQPTGGIVRKDGALAGGGIATKSGTATKTGTTHPDDHFDPDWPPKKNLIWHLDDAFSGLRSAREAVKSIPFTVRIAHFDTGYPKKHGAISDAVRKNPLQRNFVEEDAPFDAHDRAQKGTLKMPYHGAGTLGVLAGGKVKLDTAAGPFHDFIGGAPEAEIVCCRIAPSVVLVKTSAFAEALNYLVDLTQNGTPIHVLTMSMGGAPSRAWADAVNAAYEAGIVMVTAAGNHFNGLPTDSLIYPARFGRVLAACGVTHAGKPYLHSKIGEMQGCYGPSRYMGTALAAFTPNIPWASGATGRINFSGAGTSCATPQIAAAAAHYIRRHHGALSVLLPWQRVEAVRHALFTSADKTRNGGDSKKYFGNGVLQAHKALAVPVKVVKEPTPPDSIPLFPILATLLKSKPGAAFRPSVEEEMYHTELAQLVFENRELRALIGNEARDYRRISAKAWSRFRDAVIAHPQTSASLKRRLTGQR